MDIQIVLLGIAVLIVAWTLERVFSKMQSLDRHVKGMRKRLNILERRLVNESRSSSAQRTLLGQRTAAARRESVPVAANSPSSAQSHNTAQLKQSGKRVLCSFCGIEYDIKLPKCPKCNHINIEKYKVRRKADDEFKGDDELDI